MVKKSIIFDFLIFILIIYLFVYIFNYYKNTEKFSDNIITNLKSKINNTTAKKGEFCSDYRITDETTCKETGLCLNNFNLDQTNCSDNWKKTTYWNNEATKFEIFKNKLDILNKLATCDNCAPSNSDFSISQDIKNKIDTGLTSLETKIPAYHTEFQNLYTNYE